jgi:exoribonuclease-2
MGSYAVMVVCCCVQALLTSPPADPDAATRMDLTHLTVYTIDDASTKDVDDGISVEQSDDGQLLLWVHIADPTRWLRPGTATHLCAHHTCDGQPVQCCG